MKRLIVNMFIAMAALLQLVALNSCSPDTPEEQPVGAMPKVQPYNVFSFKEDWYAEHLWALNNYYNGKQDASDDDYILWNDISAGLKYSYLSGEPMYLQLHDGFLICKNTTMHPAAVVLKEKEEGHDTDRWFYSKSDILDAQPFAKFCKIPGSALGINSVQAQYEITDEDMVPRINALIDDGSIEQYRVDLGY